MLHMLYLYPTHSLFKKLNNWLLSNPFYSISERKKGIFSSWNKGILCFEPNKYEYRIFNITCANTLIHVNVNSK
jgi:hypothetical protein